MVKGELMNDNPRPGIAGGVALVTGAAAGIGAAYCRALAEQGVDVTVFDLDGPGAKAQVDAINARGGRSIAVEGDVTDPDSVADAITKTTTAFGAVTMLVNNAALHLHEYAQPCTELALEKWRRLFEVNVTGPRICAEACRDVMAARGGGVIINQVSVAAYRHGTGGAYGVSKLALCGLTSALAVEFADLNIRVNGIAPGMIASEVVLRDTTEEQRASLINEQLVKRQGQMSDLVSALLFLCSEDASFISGETLLVAGGRVRRL